MHTDKKLLFLTFAVLSLMLGACSHKRSESDSMRKAPAAVPDTTIYGRLSSVDGDSISLKMLSHDKTYRLSVAESKRDGMIKGDLNVGDTLAVLANRGSKKVMTSVNLSMIHGLWRIKGGKGDMVRLSPDGGASFVGNRAETLRSWFITNGMFILTYVPSDGTDYKERHDTAEIHLLDKDNLVVGFKSKTLEMERSTGLITVDDLK